MRLWSTHKSSMHSLMALGVGEMPSANRMAGEQPKRECLSVDSVSNRSASLILRSCEKRRWLTFLRVRDIYARLGR